MSEQLACYVADIDKGGVIGTDLTKADGTVVRVAVVRTEDDEIYAIGDVCSHGEVSLSEGDLDGCKLECWAHGGTFDVRTGEATAFPAFEAVPSYPVRIDGERVLVDADNSVTSTKELT